MPHKHVACFLLSEEVLGAHDSVQRYLKYQLAVPLRLLPLSGAKHRLSRDVSKLPPQPAQRERWPVFAPGPLTFALFTCDITRRGRDKPSGTRQHSNRSLCAPQLEDDRRPCQLYPHLRHAGVFSTSR